MVCLTPRKEFGILYMYMSKTQRALYSWPKLCAIVFAAACIIAGILIAPRGFAAEEVSIISSSKWKTTNSCVSGAYTMESSVTWGTVRDSKRQITNVKILQGQKDDDFSSKKVDYTVRVETQTATDKWKEVSKYGPKTEGGPISFNPANPTTLGYGSVRVRVTAGVDGDKIAGCTVEHYDREPTVDASGNLVVPAPITTEAPENVPPNQGNWVSGAAFTPNKTALALERQTYGTLDKIKKKYTQVGIAAVADSAGNKLKTCKPNSPLDPVVVWGEMYCFKYISQWRQQGITGSGSSGMLDRSDIIIASQYDHTSNNAARLVVMNTTTKKYEYATLVRPCDDSGGFCRLGTGKTGYGCKETHAGGLAWYKDTLFVADGNCFIAFNMNDFYKLSDGSLILPTSYFWHSRFPEKMLLSTAALDTTGPKPQIVATEYMKANNSGKCGTRLLGRWDLSAQTGDFEGDSGNAKISSADVVLGTSSVCEVQGVASYNGMHFMNSSYGTSEYMHRFRTVDSNPVDTKFLMPRRVPEGIYIDTKSSQVWSLVELETKDDQVRVFSMGLQSILQ